jgi:hypothetical protein
VQAILIARIDRLPPDEKDLLQTLAVLGMEFTLRHLKAMVARSDSELERMLADLQMAEFIYEQPSLGDVEFTFKHALIQEVAYHSVLTERRLPAECSTGISATEPGKARDCLRSPGRARWPCVSSSSFRGTKAP